MPLDSRIELLDLRSTARWAILILVFASALRMVIAVALGWQLSFYLSGISFLCGLAGYALALNAYPKAGLLLVIGGTIAACSVSAYNYDGLGNVGIPIICVIVAFSGLLFDTLLLKLVTAYSMLLIGLMVAGRCWIQQIPFNPSEAGDLVILMITIAVAALFSQMVSRQLLRSIDQALSSQSKLNETALALSDSEQRWHLALVGANDGMWDWEIEEDRMFFSDRWKGILGYAPDELEDSRDVWQSLVHEEDLAQVSEAVSSHLAGKTSFYSLEYRMKTKQGDYRWILARGRALFNEAGKAIRFTGSHTDITERRQSEQNVRAANQAKSNFLANMSHEIRTPLNAVTGFSDLLEQSNLDCEQRELVRMIRSSSRLLLSIINNVLDFSKLDQGRMKLHETPCALRHLIGSTIEIPRVEANRKQLFLSAQIDSHVPEWIVADSTCLQQVLLNLVSNAVKFTEAGSVEVWVTPAQQPDQLRFEVIDSGIGVPPEMASRLFEDFYQGDASITRRIGGTGLGLAISRRIVKLMGGEIGLLPNPAQGVTFWFQIPFKACQAELTPEQTEKLVLANGRNTHILLAEDNPVNQRVMMAILSRLGCEVSLARDGKEAVDSFQSKNFDLIFMDCHMPNQDGFWATRQIRELGIKGATIPIIALTADVLESNRERCLASGMTGYLAKPIDIQRVRRALSDSGILVSQDDTSLASFSSPVQPN